MSVLYAEIIVDVSTYHVDRSFDYAVPAEWVAVIEKGCRVKVPFGPRNVLGFVVGLKHETEVPTNKLKPIAQILDIEPVFTEEMLLMAKWLKNETICYEIDALQVMLPSALRAKYEKSSNYSIIKRFCQWQFNKFSGSDNRQTLRNLNGLDYCRS